jgi:hypothetical protein
MLLFAALAGALAAPPELALLPTLKPRCGLPLIRQGHDWVQLRGGPEGLCAVEIFWARLEAGAVDVLVRVRAPHREDPELRERLFVYRLVGTTLVPRFLGSGFETLDLVGAERVTGAPLDAVRVWVVPRGALAPRTGYRCGFDGFALRCEPE